MLTRFLKAATTVITLALLLSGCQTKPVLNINNSAVNQGLTIEQVENAITKAGLSKGWTMRTIEPGLIRGEINVRGRHFAAIDITYSAETYSINYADSANLRYSEKPKYTKQHKATANYDPTPQGEYEGPVIHRNYNKWITLLDRQIKIQLAYPN